MKTNSKKEKGGFGKKIAIAGLATLLSLIPFKTQAQDKRFSVGLLYEVGQPAYTSLKAEHEDYNKLHNTLGGPGYIPGFKDLTNPGLLHMLGAEASVKLTENLNAIGSFSTSIGNEWKYNETYNKNGYKTIERTEKADIKELNLGLEGTIQVGNFTFSAGGGAVWNDVDFQSDHTTTWTDTDWVKSTTKTSGNGWGYFIDGKIIYKFNKNWGIGAGVSYENNPVGTSGNIITNWKNGKTFNEPTSLNVELERANFKFSVISIFD